MLHCKNLRFNREGFKIEADFILHPVSITALLGESGSGKSTLLNLLGGFLKPQSGELLWKNQLFQNTSPWERPFGVLFAEKNLFPHLTVEKNLDLAFFPQKSPPCFVSYQEILEICEISHLLKRYPDEISTGEEQRVALARTLLQKKPFLLLDEPFSALNPRLRKELGELLMLCNKTRNIGILVATHHPHEFFGSQFLFMEAGKCTGPHPKETLEREFQDYIGH